MAASLLARFLTRVRHPVIIMYISMNNTMLEKLIKLTQLVWQASTYRNYSAGKCTHYTVHCSECTTGKRECTRTVEFNSWA